MRITSEQARAQARTNYEAFCDDHLSRLLVSHRGEWAILRDGEVIDLSPTMLEAYGTGYERFPDERFSIQQVQEQRPVEMGHRFIVV